jgi:hypothetical protein
MIILKKFYSLDELVNNFYSPIIVINNFLSLDSNNSKNIILCHVPNKSFPSFIGIHKDCDNKFVFICAVALIFPS